MAEHKVVNADQLDADLTSVADSIRTKAGTSDKLAFPAGMKEAVDNLSTFVPPSSMALDPDEVYRTTRPKDWLPMPTPGDDEVYLLNLIPEGLDGAFTAQVSFTGTCTVEFGNLVDGVFVAKETVTPTSGTRFFHTVYWDDYGDETSDGYRQYLVRIKGSFTQALLYPNTDDVYSYGVPILVDAVSGADADVRFGVNTTPSNNCDRLQYVRFVGNGRLTRNSGMNFRYCQKLKSVSAERESGCSYMKFMFDGCNSLLAFSPKLLASGVDYVTTFTNTSFRVLPQKEIHATNVNMLFGYSAIHEVVDGRYLITSQCEDFQNFCVGSGVRHVHQIDISSATKVGSMFDRCNLVSLTFAGETTPGGFTINLTTSIMSHKALVNMINSLPTALSPATITITGNPGASALTDEEIAVATARNWTVTI